MNNFTSAKARMDPQDAIYRAALLSHHSNLVAVGKGVIVATTLALLAVAIVAGAAR